MYSYGAAVIVGAIGAEISTGSGTIGIGVAVEAGAVGVPPIGPPDSGRAHPTERAPGPVADHLIREPSAHSIDTTSPAATGTRRVSAEEAVATMSIAIAKPSAPQAARYIPGVFIV
jgi:hypothetical protein